MLSPATETKHLEFHGEGVERFDFRPGQFISIVAPNQQHKLMTRAYSFASAPYLGNRFDLCLNRVADGFFSNFLCDMKVGDTVQFHGPHGTFVLHEPLRDLLLIATGTGVAPMRGFVQWLFSEERPCPTCAVKLVFGTRY